MKKPPTATLLVIAIAVASLVGALYPRPPAPGESLRDCESNADSLVTETQVLRIFAKGQIAREVQEGRPLLEGAALFGALNRLLPEQPAPPASHFDNPHRGIPAHTAEDRLCRQVVAWVDRQMGPDGRDGTITRLAAEYRCELRTQGVIRLPDLTTLEPIQELLARARIGRADVQRKSLVGNRREGGS
jgi:hypothetical protein